MGIPEWEWALGAGVYLDDLESDIADMRHQLIAGVKAKILVICIVLLVFIIICYHLARHLARKVQADFNYFTRFFHESLENSVCLEPEAFELDEFESLAIAANRMIEQRNSVEETLRHNQKMDTIGQLAGGIAHDFNNALGGVKGAVSLLRVLLGKKRVDFDHAVSMVDLIEKSSTSAAGIVNQLLTLSQKHQLELKDVDLNDIIRKTVQLCLSGLDKQIEVVTKYLHHTAVVKADEVQLEQVLLNLCINASHAMTVMRDMSAEPGGRLTIALETYTVEKNMPGFEKNDWGAEYYVCRVSDTGVGIDPDLIEKIFDPFFTTKSKEDGTGLGLSMVYRIVQLHGGHCSVVSKPGSGTTFNVFIPKSDTSEVSSANGTEPVYKGQGIILVIDDDSNIRSTVNSILTECGYDVILAPDGVSGIEEFKLRHSVIDLIILDMSMPRMSGKETLLELKKIDADVSVLMASGFGKDSRFDECGEIGMSGFIQKPFTIGELSSKVSDALADKK